MLNFFINRGKVRVIWECSRRKCGLSEAFSSILPNKFRFVFIISYLLVRYRVVICRFLNQIQKYSRYSFAQDDSSVLLENHNHRNHLLRVRMEKKGFSTITGKKFGDFYAIHPNPRGNFWLGSLKAFHPESLGAWWKHSSRREHVILDSNLLSVLAKGNLFTSSPSNCRKHTTLRHDLKQIANFFCWIRWYQGTGEHYTANSSHYHV